MQKIDMVIIEHSGAGWYGEVYGFGRNWSWAAAVDLVDRLNCQKCEGFSSAASAERSLRAFVKVEHENDIDRWVSLAASLG